MLPFTKQEKQVIIFLLTIALFGLGIDFLSKRFSQVKAIAYTNPNLGKINLNHADKETLMIIPGIGKTLAARIIEYRKQNNGFSSLDELKRIKGITQNRYQKLEESVFID